MVRGINGPAFEKVNGNDLDSSTPSCLMIPIPIFQKVNGNGLDKNTPSCLVIPAPVLSYGRSDVRTPQAHMPSIEWYML